MSNHQPITPEERQRWRDLLREYPNAGAERHNFIMETLGALPRLMEENRRLAESHRRLVELKFAAIHLGDVYHHSWWSLIREATEDLECPCDLNTMGSCKRKALGVD